MKSINSEHNKENRLLLFVKFIIGHEIDSICEQESFELSLSSSKARSTYLLLICAEYQ